MKGKQRSSKHLKKIPTRDIFGAVFAYSATSVIDLVSITRTVFKPVFTSCGNVARNDEAVKQLSKNLLTPTSLLWLKRAKFSLYKVRDWHVIKCVLKASQWKVQCAIQLPSPADRQHCQILPIVRKPADSDSCFPLTWLPANFRRFISLSWHPRLSAATFLAPIRPTVPKSFAGVYFSETSPSDYIRWFWAPKTNFSKYVDVCACMNSVHQKSHSSSTWIF